ncbi:hypothetical protein KAU55_03970 [Candidatus Bathyarchaeota archaeon]|nr:hypothetical protein [Candidatus Bathyarchaeota archaeon]
MDIKPFRKVMWKQTLLRLILFLGCGSSLTLLSGFYSYPGSPMFMDVVPTEVRSLKFGFPFPIYSSYAAWWGDGGYLTFHVTFVWLGALLDVIFYAFILWINYWAWLERLIKKLLEEEE